MENIVEEIKEILGKYELTKDLTDFIGESNIEVLDKTYINIKGDFWNNLFDKISPALQGEKILYHYKGLNFAKDILKNKSIQISNLTSNEYNDYAEYTEYLKKIEAYHPLVNNEILDDSRNNLLILCFTEKPSDFMWKNYGDEGVCFKIKISMSQQNTNENYPMLRKVYYNAGNKFDFISELNYFLYKKYKVRIIDDHTTRHALFFKREIYHDEREWRLAFNCIQDYFPLFGSLIDYSFNSVNTNYFQHVFIDVNSGRKYSNLEFGKKYPLFTMNIEEVIVNDKVSQKDFEELKELAGNINVVYKRKS